VNARTKKPLPAWLPFVVGWVLVAQFAALGVWQITRGFEKRESQQLFQDETGFSAWHDGMEVRPFQQLKATGRYDGGRQVLLENIIINSRYGYYVITPLVDMDDEPVLLVNRGWIEKDSETFDVTRIDVPADRLMVRGRVGSLPRAGMRMGDSFTPGDDWPRNAVFPTLDDVAAQLGQDVQPFVLLMDSEEEHGFFRNWVPTEFGPDKHFGYALQWFAMGIVLAGLLVWNYRRKRFK
jgi:surfeit locus 1 family protein